MTNLLIPYVPLPDHPDPILDEFTYGDIDKRARKLKRDLRKGDYLFLQATSRGRRYITAYYVVDRVMDTSEAAKNKLIRAKYKNPHIASFLAGKRWRDDVLVFGDPILSRRLPSPLPFDRSLARRLSLGIRFTKEQTELSRISSHTRQWRPLTEADTKVLLRKIEKMQNKAICSDILLSTDEIQELRETDLEELVSRKPNSLERGLKVRARQYELTPKERIDLLLTDAKGDYVVVELKPGPIGRSALAQARRYVHELRKRTKKKVRAIIVCKDILPAFKKIYKSLRDLKVYYYGWRIDLIQSEID
jgi:hypothetical protein